MFLIAPRVCPVIHAAGTGVEVGVLVGVNVVVFVGVNVGVLVRVGVLVGVNVGVAVNVGEGVGVGDVSGESNIYFMLYGPYALPGEPKVPIDIGLLTVPTL